VSEFSSSISFQDLVEQGDSLSPEDSLGKSSMLNLLRAVRKQLDDIEE
jgi:hypothetical protein